MHRCTFASPIGTTRFFFIDGAENHFLKHPRPSDSLYPLQRSALFYVRFDCFWSGQESQKIGLALSFQAIKIILLVRSLTL